MKLMTKKIRGHAIPASALLPDGFILPASCLAFCHGRPSGSLITSQKSCLVILSSPSVHTSNPQSEIQVRTCLRRRVYSLASISLKMLSSLLFGRASLSRSFRSLTWGESVLMKASSSALLMSPLLLVSIAIGTYRLARLQAARSNQQSANRWCVLTPEQGANVQARNKEGCDEFILRDRIG